MKRKQRQAKNTLQRYARRIVGSGDLVTLFERTAGYLHISWDGSKSQGYELLRKLHDQAPNHVLPTRTAPKGKPKRRHQWQDDLAAEITIVIEDFNARLSLLFRWARVVVGRPRFDLRKQHRGLIRRKHLCCWTGCGGPHDVTHHIVQLQNGGDNATCNRVRLCHRCHAFIHPWLNEDGTTKPEALIKRMELPEIHPS